MFDVVDCASGEVMGQLSIEQVILSQVVTHEPVAMKVPKTIAWDWWAPRPEQGKDVGTKAVL